MRSVYRKDSAKRKAFQIERMAVQSPSVVRTLCNKSKEVKDSRCDYSLEKEDGSGKT